MSVEVKSSDFKDALKLFDFFSRLHAMRVVLGFGAAALLRRRNRK